MAMTFAQLEREYEKMWQAYEEGTLHSEDFSKALAEMRVEDAQGQWWQIKWNGKWMRYNGHDWEEATPPKASPPPPPPEALLPPPRPRAAEPPRDAGGVLVGVTADQIPAPQPAPAAFLLTLKADPAPGTCKPIPVEAQARPLARPPLRPAGAPPEVAAEAPARPAALGADDCPKCHKRLVSGARFCRYCGTDVQARPEPGPAKSEPAMAACIKCHHPIHAGAKFCGSCGQAQPTAPRNCPHCQATLAVPAKFCPGCGQSLQS